MGGGGGGRGSYPKGGQLTHPRILGVRRGGGAGGQPIRVEKLSCYSGSSVICGWDYNYVAEDKRWVFVDEVEEKGMSATITLHDSNCN